MQITLIVLMLGMLMYWGILKIKHSFHMLQLSHYDKNRYLKWYKTYLTNDVHAHEILLITITFYLMLTTAFNEIFTYIILLAIATFFAFRRDIKKAKKPLIFTWRIKRLMLTKTLIITLITALSLYISKTLTLVENNYIYIYVILFICFKLIYLITFLSLILNNPVENKIKNKYKIKAIEKIKALENLEVVGITGSYGKTSTKNILNALLSTKKHVCSTPKSYNTPMGITKTILDELKSYDELLICEMGAFKVGEITENCNLVNPKYGILTSVGPQHLETFLNINNVVKTKLELINSLPENGIGVLNIDYKELLSATKSNYKAKIITFAIENEAADYKIVDYSFSSEGTEFMLKIPDGSVYQFTMPLLGKHNLYNAVGGIALAHSLNIEIHLLQTSLRNVDVIPHRLEVKKYADTTIIDDAYNANPVGTKNALEVLSMFDGVKIVITPGMVDLGIKQREINEEYGENIATVADYTFIVGNYNKRALLTGLFNRNYDNKKIYTVNNLKQATEIISNMKIEKKVILLANDLTDNYL